MSDIKNILNQINALSDQIEVYIPSFGETIKIKQLTVKQCKELINMPQNLLHAQYSFFRKFYNILKENAPDHVNDFNIVDRVAIMIALRAKALGKCLALNGKGERETINLNDIVPLIPKVKYDLIAPTIETEHYSFTLKIPTLQSEDAFNKYIINTFKLPNTKSVEEMASMSQELFGELAIIEICKYVTHMTIKTDDTEINLEELSPDQRKKILESIQLEELQVLIDFNTKVHAVEAEYTNYTIAEQSYQLEIGPDFFVFI